MEQGMTCIARCVLSIGCIVSSVPSWAQSIPPEREVRVQNGKEIQLMVLSNSNPNCSGSPVPEVRILEAPRNGIIIVRVGQVPYPNSASTCAGKEVPGVGVFYRSFGGFQGSDKVRVEASVLGQSDRQQTINLVVTK